MPRDQDFREPSWMCTHCGYVMDTAASMTGKTAPVEGDLSVCMNCGEVYLREHARWRLMTLKEFAKLTQAERQDIVMLQLARVKVIDQDLNKGRGGRA